jgi:hypothetical protein
VSDSVFDGVEDRKKKSAASDVAIDVSAYVAKHGIRRIGDGADDGDLF